MAVQRGSEGSKLIGVAGRTEVQDSASSLPERAIRRTANTGSPKPRARSPRASSTAGASSKVKLLLLEALVATSDLTDCAQRAIEWLRDRGLIKQAMCALVEQGGSKLVGVASCGLSPVAIRKSVIDLEDGGHSLQTVLKSGKPATFRRNADRGHLMTPFGNASFTAFPLASEHSTQKLRSGALLTSPVNPKDRSDILWLAGVLGPQLARLQTYNMPGRAYELDLKVRAATAALMQQNDILNQQNELLNQQRLALEQASSLKSQFLANMSHEFRTPLNAILGYTSMLLQGMGGELNAQQTQMLMRVDSNGKNLRSLINDILDISRIEAGKMPVHFAEFRVTEVVPELLAELEPMISRSKLSVNTELKEVPTLRSDKQKVKQILLNLITNALKFTPKGSVTISTAYDPSARQITASVKDTGIGISESDQVKLFNDFHQADSSTTRQYGGAGLGLSICRRLASMLGGHITLTSTLDQGSTFTLILPRHARHR